MINVTGWIEYNGEPASEVLVQVSLEKKQNKIVSENITSNENGNFSSSLTIPQEINSGNYTIDVTSFCKEIHSNVCTYQFEELPITIRAE